MTKASCVDKALNGNRCGFPEQELVFAIASFSRVMPLRCRVPKMLTVAWGQTQAGDYKDPDVRWQVLCWC